MDKVEILLKNYEMLSKKPIKNANALKKLILQLFETNSKLAIQCWENLLLSNESDLKKYYKKTEFDYDSIGSFFVEDLEGDVVERESFKYSVLDFAKAKNLLNILYSLCPISSYSRVYYAIAYLIRNNNLQEADNILTAIYKNTTFNDYSSLWENIVDRFKYCDLDNYCGGGVYDDELKKQPKEIQNFCMSWVERINDDEQRAGAMTFILDIF